MTRELQKEMNRAILLTPPGLAAIAVVRLIGPGVAAFLRRHFSKEPKPGRCVHGTLSDGPHVIDDPVVVLLPDVGGADINLHGGTWVVRSMLDLAAQGGFEIVEPAGGAAPLEAVEGDTLLEREVAAHLPLAKTELGLRVLLGQVEAWDRLKKSSPAPADIKQLLADATLWHLLHPPTVAIVGAANVGKSTLANQLFGQERSITADLPGTTRDWVGEIANINGLAVMLVDTPGLRPTTDAIEQAAIAASRARIEESELIVLVLDAARPMEPEQAPLLAAYPRAVAVVNKSDQPPQWSQSEFRAIHTVATTGAGIDALRRAIAVHFGCAEVDTSRPRCWTQRQREILMRAIVESSLVNEL